MTADANEKWSAKRTAATLDWDAFERVFLDEGEAPREDIEAMERAGLLYIEYGEVTPTGGLCWGSDDEPVRAVQPHRVVVMMDDLQVWANGRGFWKGRPSCHLMVNGERPEHMDELHRVAAAAGCRREWFQGAPKHRTPHYDLTESRRAAAMRAGAVYVSAREQAMARVARRRAKVAVLADQKEYNR